MLNTCKNALSALRRAKMRLASVLFSQGKMTPDRGNITFPSGKMISDQGKTTLLQGKMALPQSKMAFPQEKIIFPKADEALACAIKPLARNNF